MQHFDFRIFKVTGSFCLNLKEKAEEEFDEASLKATSTNLGQNIVGHVHPTIW